MKLVHWLNIPDGISGLYNYTFALHNATQQLGYESHICFWSKKDGGRLLYPRGDIIEASPHSISQGAINITHDQLPPYNLDNWVTEMHGMPQFTARELDPLSVACYKLKRADLIFTRFPSHIQYWQELTDKPIHVIPAGVDLERYKPEGKKVSWTRPVILWADTWRDPVKNPMDLLYAMKLINKELPMHGLKLVGIPSEKIQTIAYMAGRLGLDSCIEWPIETMVQNMDEVYRGADVMYSDTNHEGSNSSWEAEACGLSVVHHQNSPKEIAWAIIERVKLNERIPIRRDIKETARKMMDVLEIAFEHRRDM